VEVPGFWPAACAALEETHPANLAEGLKRLLPHAPIPVANHLATTLIELGATQEEFLAIAEEILREPIMLNEGLLWLWNGPSPKGARVPIPLVTILTRVLHAMGELLRDDSIGRERSRQIALNTRDVLKARKHKRFQDMLEQIEPGVAMALRTQITRLHNLARTGDDLLRLIRLKFPELTIVAPQLPMWLQDDVLYVTQAGYRRKREELDELVTVKIRENAVAIGRAAEHGDLSENSEYKFALEERDLLQARLAQMQRQMEQARVLQPRDVPTDHIGIGSQVVLEHADGVTRLELKILSPWEADPEGRIVNYQTPLAQTLLGAKVGQTIAVEFFSPPGEYRVISVASAIQDT
jgi:transcription elongation factor GreA